VPRAAAAQSGVEHNPPVRGAPERVLWTFNCLDVSDAVRWSVAELGRGRGGESRMRRSLRARAHDGIVRGEATCSARRVVDEAGSSAGRRGGRTRRLRQLGERRALRCGEQSWRRSRVAIGREALEKDEMSPVASRAPRATPR
jgi:hypothetical protein